jgi:hypothetical protein
MKKIIFFLSSLFILASCSNTLEDYDGIYEGTIFWHHIDYPNDRYGNQSSIEVIKTTSGYSYYDNEVGKWLDFSNQGVVTLDSIYVSSGQQPDSLFLELDVKVDGDEIRYQRIWHFSDNGAPVNIIVYEGILSKQ